MSASASGPQPPLVVSGGDDKSVGEVDLSAFTARRPGLLLLDLDSQPSAEKWVEPDAVDVDEA